MTATMTSQEIDQLIESNDVTGLDALATRNGMTEARNNQSHSALWHNIQLPQFARIVSIVFGGKVCRLPDASVYKTAQVLAKKAKGKISIAVEVAETPAGQTVYNVGGSTRITVS